MFVHNHKTVLCLCYSQSSALPRAFGVARSG